MKFNWRTTAHRIVPPTGADGFQHVHGAKVREEKPPIFDACAAAFQINPRVVFTYGDTLYNPFKLHLPEDLVEHEKVHMAQQGHSDDGAALWWGRYLRDEKFRLAQETAAYGRQYAVLRRMTSDREQLAKWLNALAGSLSGPLYGGCVGHMEAALLIKQEAGL